MGKIITFGEIMLSLNPEGYLRIPQAGCFMASYAGGEANVSVSLANYGEETAFVTYVPDNAIGESAINALRHWGVDTKYMFKGGSRLGIYFVEKGASQRHTNFDLFYPLFSWRILCRIMAQSASCVSGTRILGLPAGPDLA